MAEAIVAAALAASAKFLAKEATSAAITCVCQQLSYVTQVRERLEEIQRDLDSIKSVLGDAEWKAKSSEVVRNWLEEVRDVCFQVVNILDKREYDLLHHPERCLGLPRVVNLPVCKGCVNNILLMGSSRKALEQLDSIKARVEEILKISRYLVVPEMLTKSDYGDEYHFYGPKDFSRNFVEPKDFSRNFDEPKDRYVFFSSYDGVTTDELLKRWILEESPAEISDWRWRVIAVWGMGGVGKTTLVRKVFRNPPINFEVYVWVNVSRTYKMDNLLWKMLKEMELNIHGTVTEIKNEQNAAIDITQLIEKVREKLRNKKYLIVFDDISDTKFCEDIEHLFRGDHNSASRILVTSRYWEVAMSLAQTSRVMELRPLEETEAWHLFCSKAFWDESQQKCPASLEHLARGIMEKCYGLPLAIEAAGKFMSRKERTAKIWEISSRLLASHLIEGPLSSIFDGCYYSLERHLKSCFLYCGAFPENYAFAKEDIIRLWIAEGFVATERKAEEYFDKLIHQSLFQVEERADSGEVKSCRVHDVFRRRAIELSSAQRFYAVLEGDIAESNVKNAYRLSIPPGAKGFPSEADWSSLRSFSMFRGDDISARFSSFNFKLLKVLNLRDSAFSRFPDEIFSLYLLRYLCLSNTGIEVIKIPEKIKRLQELQTFQLLHVTVKPLPRAVAKLKKLRHLVFDGPKSGGLAAPVSICKLKDLQTLKHVKASEDLVKNIGKLTRLRALWISKVEQAHGEALLESLRSATNLRELTIRMVSGSSIDLQNLDPPPKHLQFLSIEGGCLLENPECFSSLNELKELYLKHCRVEKDPCTTLGTLQSLAVLSMSFAYEGSSLTISSGSFPNLKVLCISDSHNLEFLEINQPTLPKLRKLQISRCTKLRDAVFLAEGLQELEEFKLEGFDSKVADDFYRLTKRSSKLTLTVISRTDMVTRRVPSAETSKATYKPKQIVEESRASPELEELY